MIWNGQQLSPTSKRTQVKFVIVSMKTAAKQNCFLNEGFFEGTQISINLRYPYYY